MCRMQLTIRISMEKTEMQKAGAQDQCRFDGLFLYFGVYRQRHKLS